MDSGTIKELVCKWKEEWERKKGIFFAERSEEEGGKGEEEKERESRKRILTIGEGIEEG